jgi:hypothetical protein
LRCLGLPPGPTCTRLERAGETCTCNGRTSPRVWERVGISPVSWTAPRSSRHPTSLEAASWSWHGLACPRCWVGNGSRRRFRASSTGQARTTTAVLPTRSAGADSTRLRQSSSSGAELIIRAPEPAPRPLRGDLRLAGLDVGEEDEVVEGDEQRRRDVLGFGTARTVSSARAPVLRWGVSALQGVVLVRVRSGVEAAAPVLVPGGVGSGGGVRGRPSGCAT